MTQNHPNDPLHGITLKAIVTELQERYGWEGLAQRININCFKSNPSINSSLKFLRRTPWARQKVEELYITTKKRTQTNQAPVDPWSKSRKS
ncbi:VF530 family DNA-binding protein [Pleionea sp. CnH1-48]|uniref:VF530 family protein n=1 Tax=Pleionea sp. CnH1-48 TaxID=2954494 RepID=UPI0020981A12|nr:VF530 family protein [Pleionea sp. CnH1-48]MCO7224494.1 VF530 family protein [Pleionea sp. CnH1-48]